MPFSSQSNSRSPVRRDRSRGPGIARCRCGESPPRPVLKPRCLPGLRPLTRDYSMGGSPCQSSSPHNGSRYLGKLSEAATPPDCASRSAGQFHSLGRSLHAFPETDRTRQVGRGSPRVSLLDPHLLGGDMALSAAVGWCWFDSRAYLACLLHALKQTLAQHGLELIIGVVMNQVV